MYRTTRGFVVNSNTLYLHERGYLILFMHLCIAGGEIQTPDLLMIDIPNDRLLCI